MLIFSDFHHHDLFHSLRMLFENRLKGKMYIPIGEEWAEQGYWKYHLAAPKENQIPVMKQYLQHEASDGENTKEKGTRIRADYRHGDIFNMLSLKEFFKKPIDIVIASVANHEEPFWRLAQQHPNRPKFIRQAGNVNEIIDYTICKNIMVSSGKLINPPPKDINAVYYHQEFDLNTYYYQPPYKVKSIKNFMNCLPNTVDAPKWDMYKQVLPEFEWKMFGILGTHGIIGKPKDIADEMRNSAFVWHVKFGGDGFGHITHNSFAVGRPVICIKEYYDYEKGQLAGKLLEDQETCIDIGIRRMEENVKLIRHWAEPKNHLKMCEKVYKKFREVVDYEQGFKEIKKFLKRL